MSCNIWEYMKFLALGAILLIFGTNLISLVGSIEPELDLNMDITVTGTMGANGWFISCVTIAFSNENVMFSLDGNKWQAYTSPIMICEDGWHILEYSFPEEPIKSKEFKIDQTSPKITECIANKSEPFKWLLTIHTYDTTSGINQVKFYLDDELKETDMDEPYEWEYSGIGGGHTIKAVVYDNAMNSISEDDIPFTLSYSYSQSYTLSQNVWFQWFLEQHPRLLPILRELLRL